jgi:pullulanase/glycogen debranching enzyme
MRRRYPQLQPQRWLNGSSGNRPPDILWVTPQGSEMTPDDWAFPAARFLAYVMAGIDDRGTPLFTVMNAGADPIEFVFPEFLNLESWLEILCSAPRSDGQGRLFSVGATDQAPSHSIMVFEGRT